MASWLARTGNHVRRQALMPISLKRLTLTKSPQEYDPNIFSRIFRSVELYLQDIIEAETVGIGCPISFSTNSATVADSLTVYLGSAHHHATEANVSFCVPFQCIAKNLYVNSAATAAGDRAYTLRKNGVDTSITCASTVAVSSAFDIVHKVSFEAGDLISLKLVTTNLTTVVSHRATLELYKTST